MLQVTNVVQPDGGSVYTTYYSNGLRRLTWGSRTYPVEYNYDAQGRMTTMKTWQDASDPNTIATTTWNYNGYGQLQNKRYPDNTGPDYSYSGRQLYYRSWARGLSTSYSYNSAGELSDVYYYGDATPSVHTDYSRLGRPEIVTQGSMTTSNRYSPAGLLLSESYGGGPLDGLAVTNAYDALLRRTNVSLLAGSTVLAASGYSYDSASRLDTVTFGGNSATYAYHANSSLAQSLTFKQGSNTRMTTAKSYDLLNRLTGVSSASSASSAVSFNYAYNSASQRTRNTLVDDSYWVYEYDGLGQVTRGKRYWSDGTPVAGQQFEYGFDDIGNRTSTGAGGDATGAGLRVASYGANQMNQYTNRTVPGTNDVMGVALMANSVTVNGMTTYRRGEYFHALAGTNNTSAPAWLGITVTSGGSNVTGNVLLPQTPETFTYDADGNLTSDSLWTNIWNGENRRMVVESRDNVPTAAKVREEWTHLADGRWVERIVSTNNGSSYVAMQTNRYVWDGQVLLAVLNYTNGLELAFMRGLDLSGSLQGAGGVGGLISMTVHQGTNAGTYFYCYDGNHNVAALVNAANASVAARYEFDAFGQILRATGLLAFENPFVFSTKFCDWETGFYYYGYRYYDPSTGRWVGRDPADEAGGSNLYGAFRNSPPNLADSDGRFLFVPLGMAYKYVGGRLQAFADSTDSPGWGAAAQFAGYLYSVAGEFEAPSLPAYIDRTVGRYDNAGKVYDKERGPCGDKWFWAGWSAGAYFLGDFFGLNGVPEGWYGVDLGTGSSLDGWDRWSRGLGSGGNTILIGAMALSPFKFANQPLSFGFGEAAKATAPIEKFSNYIFKEGATHGKDAIFRGLGYGAEDSAQLAKMWQEQAVTKYAQGQYTLGKLDQYGQRINITIDVPGVGNAAGKSSSVTSGWMIRPDGSITLNTPFSGFPK